MVEASKRSKKKDGVQGVNGRNFQKEKNYTKDSSRELTQHEEEQLAKSR